MPMLARVTQTNDKGVTKTTYNIGAFPTIISLIAAAGSFCNFLVNLGAHRHWSWLILN